MEGLAAGKLMGIPTATNCQERILDLRDVRFRVVDLVVAVIFRFCNKRPGNEIP